MMSFTEDVNTLIRLSTFPVILLLIYIYCRYRTTYWKRRGVHQLENTNLIFGNFKDGITFRVSPGCQIEKIHREAPDDAPFVGFYIFHKPCLLLRDPQLIKQMLIRDYENFSDRHFGGPMQKDSTGMRNLFGLRNPAWKYVRGKIAATLSRGKLKMFLPIMMETTQPMMEYIKENSGDDKLIDVQDVNAKYSSDLIANIALGSKNDSFYDPGSDYSKLLVNFFYGLRRMLALVAVFFVPEVVQIIGHQTFFNLSHAREIFWSAVESREKSGNKRGDYIDSMIQLKNGKQDPVFKFEGDNLFFQAGQFFSGLESSSTTSSFTLMQLAKHKEYQDLAREDIKKAIAKYGWNIEAFDDMKYIDQCISEGVRMYPSVTTIDRRARREYKIPNSDIVIEKGTPIYISIYGLHGDSKHFEQPEVYNPERYSDNKKISDAYIPFGVGPRTCVGMKHGRLHVKLVLAKILTEYEVYQDPDEINHFDTRSTFTAAADGINIKFKRLVQ